MCNESWETGGTIQERKCFLAQDKILGFFRELCGFTVTREKGQEELLCHAKNELHMVSELPSTLRNFPLYC